MLAFQHGYEAAARRHDQHRQPCSTPSSTCVVVDDDERLRRTVPPDRRPPPCVGRPAQPGGDRPDRSSSCPSGQSINRPVGLPVRHLGGPCPSAADISANQQYARNADDGIGWLGSADTGSCSPVQRREQGARPRRAGLPRPAPRARPPATRSRPRSDELRERPHRDGELDLPRPAGLRRHDGGQPGVRQGRLVPRRQRQGHARASPTASRSASTPTARRCSAPAPVTTSCSRSRPTSPATPSNDPASSRRTSTAAGQGPDQAARRRGRRRCPLQPDRVAQAGRRRQEADAEQRAQRDRERRPRRRDGPAAAVILLCSLSANILSLTYYILFNTGKCYIASVVREYQFLLYTST